jgi:hydrogenase maturation protein HypF
VQGVGFRPYVYRLACSLGLGGFVRNDSRGVVAEVEGGAAAVRTFLERLRTEAPPLAVITRIGTEDVEPCGTEAFTIEASAPSGPAGAQISADTATCTECLAELRDSRDRRFRYPFINCTNCGPRFTIVRGVPYDRPLTTMAGFPMCELCRAEYEDPADRRFHAQPNACPACGPTVRLVWSAEFGMRNPECWGDGPHPISEPGAIAEAPVPAPDGSGPHGSTPVPGDSGPHPPAPSRKQGEGENHQCGWSATTGRVGPAAAAGDSVAIAAAALLEGAIVAVKGIGGYHLACRADSEAAVARLRRRKHREEKPFALMVSDIAAARRLVMLDEHDQRLLEGRERPVVLARRLPEADVAPGVAPGRRELGVMLPYSPLHHLLMAEVGAPLVMTTLLCRARCRSR